MLAINPEEFQMPIGGVPPEPQSSQGARRRLAGELFSGRYQPGERIKLREIETAFEIDRESTQKIFAEFEALGIVDMSRKDIAIVRAPNPKEMQEAYEIRAALEEIGGRTAALALKGKTGYLRKELEAMRLAVRSNDLEAYAYHDVRFHRSILQASQNQMLLRVWETLAFDIRIRASIGRVTKYLPEVVEAHQPIIEALHRGQGTEAGLLLRNHVETFVQFLKKADSNSGVHRAVVSDLESAKDVQQALFPQTNISIPGLSCQAFYRPVQAVGGDYYDFFPVQEDRWGIAIGDVSGKGMGAALIMASLQASLRSQALHAHANLAELVADVDKLVYASSPQHVFASLFYGEFQPSTLLLRYVNAGHNPPLVLRWKGVACEVFPLKPGGPPIALLTESEFVASTFQFEPGDLVVAYTDGITESENADGELWAQEGLVDSLRTCSEKRPDDIVQCILDKRFAFANGNQRDDMTLVVMRVQGQS